MANPQRPAHTPGPWMAQFSGMDAKVVCPDGRSFDIGDVIYHKENKTNARLIAAAPDLYEAATQSLAELVVLESLIDQAGTDPLAWIDVIKQRLRAALARVEGA